jgi:hypothetical protein
MRLPESLKLYLKLAVERRQIAARHTIRRIALAIAAGAVFLVGLALLNVAAFLGLRVWVGDFAAALLIAVVHLIGGGVLALLAMKERPSAEIAALTEAEAAALNLAEGEFGKTASAVLAAERVVEEIGVSLGAAAIPALVNALAHAMRYVPARLHSGSTHAAPKTAPADADDMPGSMGYPTEPEVTKKDQ